MGLFDFMKKKKEEPKSGESLHSSSLLPPIDLQNHFNVMKNTANEYSKRLENALNRCPDAYAYRLQNQQTELTIHNMELDEFSKVMKSGFVAFDLETTGLNYQNDCIVEIGAVRVRDGQLTETYHQLVNPGIHIPDRASAINHITNEMLSNQPRIYEALCDFLVFVGNDVLVAHNAIFDMRFLCNACMNHKFKAPRDCFDTMSLSSFYPDASRRSLDALLSAAGLVNENAHSALPDAIAVASLVLASFDKIDIYLYKQNPPAYSNDHCREKIVPVDHQLAGLRFCITGMVDGYERYDLEKLILSHGGKATISISNATDYLIIGTFPNAPDCYQSGKEITARKLMQQGGKIRIIFPDEFFAMLKDEDQIKGGPQ